MTKAILFPPKYNVGQVIVSERYIGTIISGFYKDGWCYNIGENVTQIEELDDSFPNARIYIKEQDVLYHWWSVNEQWVSTSE